MSNSDRPEVPLYQKTTEPRHFPGGVLQSKQSRQRVKPGLNPPSGDLQHLQSYPDQPPHSGSSARLENWPVNSNEDFGAGSKKANNSKTNWSSMSHGTLNSFRSPSKKKIQVRIHRQKFLPDPPNPVSESLPIDSSMKQYKQEQKSNERNLPVMNTRSSRERNSNLKTGNSQKSAGPVYQTQNRDAATGIGGQQPTAGQMITLHRDPAASLIVTSSDGVQNKPQSTERTAAHNLKTSSVANPVYVNLEGSNNNTVQEHTSSQFHTQYLDHPQYCMEESGILQGSSLPKNIQTLGKGSIFIDEYNQFEMKQKDLEGMSNIDKLKSMTLHPLNSQNHTSGSTTNRRTSGVSFIQKAKFVQSSTQSTARQHVFSTSRERSSRFNPDSSRNAKEKALENAKNIRETLYLLQAEKKIKIFQQICQVDRKLAGYCQQVSERNRHRYKLSKSNDPKPEEEPNLIITPTNLLQGQNSQQVQASPQMKKKPQLRKIQNVPRAELWKSVSIGNRQPVASIPQPIIRQSIDAQLQMLKEKDSMMKVNPMLLNSQGILQQNAQQNGYGHLVRSSISSNSNYNNLISSEGLTSVRPSQSILEFRDKGQFLEQLPNLIKKRQAQQLTKFRHFERNSKMDPNLRKLFKQFHEFQEDTCDSRQKGSKASGRGQSTLTKVVSNVNSPRESKKSTRRKQSQQVEMSLAPSSFEATVTKPKSSFGIMRKQHNKRKQLDPIDTSIQPLGRKRPMLQTQAMVFRPHKLGGPPRLQSELKDRQIQIQIATKKSQLSNRKSGSSGRRSPSMMNSKQGECLSAMNIQTSTKQNMFMPEFNLNHPPMVGPFSTKSYNPAADMFKYCGDPSQLSQLSYMSGGGMRDDIKTSQPFRNRRGSPLMSSKSPRSINLGMSTKRRVSKENSPKNIMGLSLMGSNWIPNPPLSSMNQTNKPLNQIFKAQREQNRQIKNQKNYQGRKIKPEQMVKQQMAKHRKNQAFQQPLTQEQKFNFAAQRMISEADKKGYFNLFNQMDQETTRQNSSMNLQINGKHQEVLSKANALLTSSMNSPEADFSGGGCIGERLAGRVVQKQDIPKIVEKIKELQMKNIQFSENLSNNSALQHQTMHNPPRSNLMSSANHTHYETGTKRIEPRQIGSQLSDLSDGPRQASFTTQKKIESKLTNRNLSTGMDASKPGAIPKIDEIMSSKDDPSDDKDVVSPKSLTDEVLTRQVVAATTGYSLIIENEQQSGFGPGLQKQEDLSPTGGVMQAQTQRPNVVVQDDNVRVIHTKTVLTNQHPESPNGEPQIQPGSAGPILATSSDHGDPIPQGEKHSVPPLEHIQQPPAPLLKTVFSQRGGDPTASKAGEGSIEGQYQVPPGPISESSYFLSNRQGSKVSPASPTKAPGDYKSDKFKSQKSQKSQNSFSHYQQARAIKQHTHGGSTADRYGILTSSCKDRSKRQVLSNEDLVSSTNQQCTDKNPKSRVGSQQSSSKQVYQGAVARVAATAGQPQKINQIKKSVLQEQPQSQLTTTRKK